MKRRSSNKRSRSRNFSILIVLCLSLFLNHELSAVTFDARVADDFPNQISLRVTGPLISSEVKASHLWLKWRYYNGTSLRQESIPVSNLSRDPGRGN